MATGSPGLIFGAASGITAEDLMFSTHLGSANMALHSSALSIPCLGHGGWHPERLAAKSLAERQINRRPLSPRQTLPPPPHAGSN